jgi:shikimate dehydrogenase
MSISTKTKRCMVIGDPVEHSLSPVMHNAAYVALGIEDDFEYEARLVPVTKLSSFIASIKTENIRGVSCTAPHKVAVMQYLDEIDPIARQIGAVNTVITETDTLKGYNTDWLGIIVPLEQRTSLAGKKVALIGAGGAARAAAYGLSERQAKLTVYNRTLSKAQELAHEYGGHAASLEDLASIQDMDIIISTLSRMPLSDERQLPALYDLIRSGQLIFDITYGSQTSNWLGEMQRRGAQVIDGLEMLLQQGVAQFTLFTGLDAPEAAMWAALQAAVKQSGGVT